MDRTTATVRPFGTLADGRTAHLFTLGNGSGIEALITDYGARLVSLRAPDRRGILTDIVLGCSSVTDYEHDRCCLGAIIGRNANRIEGARFRLDGEEYTLAANDGANNNHSGPDGYESRLWEVREATDHSVTLRMDSPDGDQGMPGHLLLDVTYELTEDDGLVIRFQGVSDRDTLLNPTNHAYFNLDGAPANRKALASIGLQWLRIAAASYYPMKDAGAVPTGERLPVAGTPMDFRFGKRIGRDKSAGFEQLVLGRGYNHSYALDKSPRAMGPVASAWSDATGIRLDVRSDLPVVQFYTADYLEGTVGRHGNAYRPCDGFALECQFAPNAINRPGELQPILAAGESFTATIAFSVGIADPSETINDER